METQKRQGGGGQVRGKRNPNANIELGLAVTGAMIHEGKLPTPVPLEVMGEACGVSWQAIQHIEEKALRKVRAAFHRQQIKGLSDLIQ